MTTLTLFELEDDQTIYDNVLFTPKNRCALHMSLGDKLNNITFNNCEFDRLCIDNDVLANCQFNNCLFTMIYIDKDVKYDNTTFNNCAFNKGRIWFNPQLQSQNIMNNCMFFHVDKFYSYD